MFSTPAREAAFRILANVQRIAAIQHTYVRDKQLLLSEQLQLRSIITSLDAAIQLNSKAYRAEAFLTAKALSFKIFLQVVFRHTTDRRDEGQDAIKSMDDEVQDPSTTAFQLMRVMQQPEQQLCSSLALCSSLESEFWQAMMGAIAASDVPTKNFFTSRLERIIVALALSSWGEAEIILQRFLWVPSIFSVPCGRVLSEVLEGRGRVGV